MDAQPVEISKLFAKGDQGFTSMIRYIVDAPRWLFLGALIWAPWAYGSTPTWAIEVLILIMAAILGLWLIGCVIRRMPPAVPPLLLGCCGALCLCGWWMALNPHLESIPGYRFVTLTPRIPFLPGSVDGPTSMRAMVRITCLLGIVCFVADLCTRRVWRRRIWHVIAGTGVSLVLFGLIQSASARPILIWNREDSTVPYFATYYYHGNAGSFINLVLPFIAGLAALMLRKPDAHGARAIWLPGFFICAAGAFVNLSRSGAAITILLCVLLLAWQFQDQSRNELLPPRRLRLAYALLMMTAVFCLVAFSGWQRPAQKWALLESQLHTGNRRFITAKVCLRMIPQAGWHGFGPGTFILVFPHFTGADALAIPGIWRYAHNDYLQTILEWGWFGSIFWAIILVGALAQLIIQWRKRLDWSTADRALAFVTFVALLGMSIHGLLDFPFQIASLQLYAAVCVGFGWGCRLWERSLLTA